MSEDTALHTKYRPKTLDDVLGHDAVVKSLKKNLEEKRSHAFLLTGQGGTGKTTIARIASYMMGCEPSDILEIDAATRTGVDDIREVNQMLQYRPLTTNGVKAIIMDECHMLSKAAWNSLLKILEEPPEWVYWFLCTTEQGKVLPTVKQRCIHYDLKPVKEDLLFDLLDAVASKEGIEVNGEVLDLCVKEANGSPRQAITNLSLCSSVTTRKEAAELLKSAEGSADVIELARALARGNASWTEISKLIGGLGETDPESVRRVVQAYLTKVVLGATKEHQITNGLAVLEQFSDPWYGCTGVAPLLVACGRIFFQR